MCKNAEDAEDVVQDTFIQYLSYKKDFESDEYIRAWFIRVAMNQEKNKNNAFFKRDLLGGMLLRNTLKEVWEDDE